jgi:exopolyphosphatase/guanosine-5'-triphosphate,3'-diphosphate pyrophosphatase
VSGYHISTPTACGLDIGSNTFSFCEVARTDSGFKIERDTSLAVRLSEGLVQGGELKPAAVARGLVALRKLANRYGLKDKPLRAVGTSVLRMTNEPEIFTAPARKILGVDIEILTGEQEALIVSRGAILGINRPGPWIIVDVGGRSIEVCWFKGGKWNPISLLTGVIDLTQRFLVTDPPLKTDAMSLREHIHSKISTEIPQNIEGSLLAVAGTATTLGAVDLDLERWQPQRLHGFIMTRARLEYWLEQMVAIPTSARTQKHGITPRRADVFPAGLCVLAEIMDHLHIDEITISVNGLRVGAALELLEGIEDGSRTGR